MASDHILGAVFHDKTPAERQAIEDALASFAYGPKKVLQKSFASKSQEEVSDIQDMLDQLERDREKHELRIDLEKSKDKLSKDVAQLEKKFNDTLRKVAEAGADAWEKVDKAEKRLERIASAVTDIRSRVKEIEDKPAPKIPPPQIIQKTIEAPRRQGNWDFEIVERTETGLMYRLVAKSKDREVEFTVTRNKGGFPKSISAKEIS